MAVVLEDRVELSSQHLLEFGVDNPPFRLTALAIYYVEEVMESVTVFEVVLQTRAFRDYIGIVLHDEVIS